MAKIKCPFCSEQIDENAVICGCCGKNPKSSHEYSAAGSSLSAHAVGSIQHNDEKQQIIGQKLFFVRKGVLLRNSPTEIIFESDIITVKKALSKKEIRYSSITSVESKKASNGMNLIMGILLAALALVMFSGGQAVVGVIGAVAALLNFASMKETAMVIKAGADSMTLRFKRNSEESDKFMRYIEIMRKN